MPNLSLGQRIGRGSVKGHRISVIMPEDMLIIVDRLAEKNRTSLSLMLVELMERGLRDLTHNQPNSRLFLTPSEVEALR